MGQLELTDKIWTYVLLSQVIFLNRQTDST
jgi:hypothetical protein